MTRKVAARPTHRLRADWLLDVLAEMGVMTGAAKIAADRSDVPSLSESPGCSNGSAGRDLGLPVKPRAGVPEDHVTTRKSYRSDGTEFVEQARSCQIAAKLPPNRPHRRNSGRRKLSNLRSYASRSRLSTWMPSRVAAMRGSANDTNISRHGIHHFALMHSSCVLRMKNA